MKNAVLSIDVEDVEHLAYFHNHKIPKSNIFNDGLDNYINILSEENVPSTFFVLSDVIKFLTKDQLDYISNQEIGSHGTNHILPKTLTNKEFDYDLKRSKELLEQRFSGKINGYRAPCFSINNEKLGIVLNNYQYDSSMIKFSSHELYGSIKIPEENKLSSCIYKLNKGYEFEMITEKFLNKSLPVSGGGYHRIFPWHITKHMLSKSISNNENLFFYFHPFEFSNEIIKLPKSVSLKTRLRFSLGKKSVQNKFRKLIHLLKFHNYNITSFDNIIKNYEKCTTHR